MELRQYATLILRWAWLIITLTTITATTSYFVSQQQTPVYQATATIIVGQSIKAIQLESSDLLISERLAQTYADIALRQPVLFGVVQTLSLNTSWQELKERVTILPVRDTQLLEIRVEANTPEEAQLIADEIARQLILLSPTALQNQEKSENQQFVHQRLADLQTQIVAGQERVGVLEESMTGSLKAQQVQEIQAEINDLKGLISDWENNYTQLLIFVEGDRSPNYLAVIEPAQPNFEPIRPRPLLNTLLAAIAGFLLSLGIIFLVEFLDDTLKTTGDFGRYFGLLSLGSINRLKGKDITDMLITARSPFDPVVEAYRTIRSNIRFMSIDKPLKTIMVTSAVAGEGKSTTVANLGIALARAGQKTIIVDTDMRRPMQHYIFQTNGSMGVTELLLSPERDVSQQLLKTAVEGLYLLPCGQLPPNPSELVGSQRMKTLLTKLASLADVVICDSPPAAVVTDAANLSSFVDGVIMVVKANSTRRGIVEQSLENLHRAKSNMMGAVLNESRQKRAGYIYQGYYSKYDFSNVLDQKPPTVKSTVQR